MDRLDYHGSVSSEDRKARSAHRHHPPQRGNDVYAHQVSVVSASSGWIRDRSGSGHYRQLLVHTPHLRSDKGVIAEAWWHQIIP